MNGYRMKPSDGGKCPGGSSPLCWQSWVWPFWAGTFILMACLRAIKTNFDPPLKRFEHYAPDTLHHMPVLSLRSNLPGAYCRRSYCLTRTFCHLAMREMQSAVHTGCSGCAIDRTL